MVLPIEIKPIEFDTIPLRYSGVFDFQALYLAAKAWYTSVYATVNWEKLYKDKVSGPGIHEVEIQLQGFVKYDRYRKWFIEVTFKTWDQKEIMVNGKQMSQGRIEIKLGGRLELDHSGMFNANPYTDKKTSSLVRTMGKLFYHFAKKDKDFNVKKKCENEMYRLQTQLKQILQMPS